MNTLFRYKNKLNYIHGLRCKNFSVISNAEIVSAMQEDHVWVAANATQMSNLFAILQLCARERAPTQAKACHAKIICIGFSDDTLTSNMLINSYSKCGLVDESRKVFDEMPNRSIISWNTMFGSYIKNGQDQEALALFINMLREGKSPVGEFTVSGVICVCAAKRDVFECKQLHGFAIKAAMDWNVFVGTALLDVYSKCGSIKDANQVFKSMPERNEVTWSSMVAGFVQSKLYEEALMLFHRAQSGSFDSRETGIEEKNIVVWNTMISGFARYACSVEVMILFEKMQQMGLCPNEYTFISVLSACSHIGLIEKGKSYFDLMVKQHNVLPNVFHYSCMVDIFGRAGLIHEAYDLIKRMPFDATASMWGSLLASCKNYGNLELAEIAAKHLFEMEPDNAGNHFLLSDIYAANRRWEKVVRSRKLIREGELRKERGKSWIEIKDKVHTFMVGESYHPRIAEIYSRLEKLVQDMKEQGYKPETKHDLHNVEDRRKQELLMHHSEKLALTFGLMCLCPGAPIRIMKNLRICGDCHTFMKFASSITGREIIVRDINRFHHFRNGCCSCREFW